jgi:toxin ParE1/3/4
MTRRRVVLSEAASFDVSDIAELLLSTRGHAAALTVYQALERAMISLEDYSNRGRIVPELQSRGISIYREMLVRPYRVIYRIVENEVFIFAVLDHRRDLDGLLHARARRELRSDK